MNKTRIIEYVIDELTKKLWNVSKPMRKRLRWMLRKRIIILEKFNKKALALNNWVKIGKKMDIISIAEMEKGIMNYEVKNQEQVDAVLALNGELRCNLKLKSTIRPVVSKWIDELWLKDHNYDFFSNVSFERIEKLTTNGISQEKIQKLLSRVEYVGMFEICGTTLNNFSLINKNIRSLQFYEIMLTGTVYIPRNIKLLQIDLSQGVHRINFGRIEELEINQEDPLFSEMTDEDIDWLDKMHGLKAVTLDGPIDNYMFFLPESIRKITTEHNCPKDSVLNNVPDFFQRPISFEFETPLAILKDAKPRIGIPTMGKWTGKMSWRPRELHIRSFDQIETKHPEIFEKLEKITVWREDFDFSCLPSTIKQIHLFGERRFESSLINRFYRE